MSDDVVALPLTQITTYLEMKSREQFKPGYLSSDEIAKNDVHVLPMKFIDPKYYRFLYRSVGEKWRWRSRLKLSDDELHREISDPNIVIEVLYYQGAPAGYFELRKHALEQFDPQVDDSSTDESNTVMLEYFGLRSLFLGKGLGKHLLSCAIQRAWEFNPSKVWVHTDNMDSPHAIPNYLGRGFEIFRTVEGPVPDHLKD
eukprot:TRINITY_DN11816_c0_g1_i1.p1 TRINITY_DN11816_c0_g1~~TRINITY_DN11816_c0_g1_i1.p1  ORF type:complete len:200 (+),score=38.07 TRINITY_DN11816_c0_g1_i1:48-647(+)